MSTVLKISEAASLAFHAMLFVAENHDQPATAKKIASELDVSEAHLAKVLQRLAKAGLLQSTRGPKGGFTLGKPAGAISMLGIYESIEGPFTSGCCLFATPVCGRSQCIFGGILPNAGKQLHEHMARTILSELAEGGLTNHANAQEDHQNR